MKTFLTHALGLTMALVLLLLAVQLTACSDGGELLVPGGAKSRLPFPDTADQLMSNFSQVYGEQDLAGYAALLHHDYEFVEVGGGTYGRDKELQIAARMFSREDYDKRGRVVAGIVRIEVLQLEGLGAWVPVADEEREILRRVYQVSLRFHRTDGSMIPVRGRSVFEVSHEALLTGSGTERAGYLIRRQIDATG